MTANLARAHARQPLFAPDRAVQAVSGNLTLRGTQSLPGLTGRKPVGSASALGREAAREAG
jgi:hypothetical protein